MGGVKRSVTRPWWKSEATRCFPLKTRLGGSGKWGKGSHSMAMQCSLRTSKSRRPCTRSPLPNFSGKAEEPDTPACTFKWGDAADCDGLMGGRIKLGHGFGRICVAEIVLLCSAGALLLCLACAWLACCQRGVGHFGHHHVRVCPHPRHLSPRFAAQQPRADAATVRRTVNWRRASPPQRTQRWPGDSKESS